MNNKVLKTLEYEKIVQKLSSRAATVLGKNKSEQLLPSVDFSEVKLRLQATDEAVKVERLKGSAPFTGIRNIKSAVKRAEIASMLNAAELLDIATTIAGGRKLSQFILSVHKDHAIPMIAKISENISDHRSVEQKIMQCINDQAEVVDSASSALRKIRQELRTGEARLRDKLEEMIRSSKIQKMLQEPIVTIRNDRYVIPVKLEYRSYFGGLVHDQSASGATLFIEPESSVALNNRLRELKLQEEREIESILRDLTALITEISYELLNNIEILAELDLIFAKAGLAHQMKASLPVMNDRGFLKIKKGRHPLISDDLVVPLDLEIGNAYSMLIITGPNTGGKTVSLKTVGLLSLMAMSGLFIPAEESSQCCVFDAIYADIGDEQSIEQSLSTFSGHMNNIISIVAEMTPKSLVLLDELGAGTDPSEGSALAISILEYMHQFGCRVMATTHYSELKAFAYDRKGIINASMEFDIETLSPTYRLLAGVPGRSNAFAIAQRLGLPSSIIENAKNYVGEEDRHVDSMIASLEANRLKAEEERKRAEQYRQEGEKFRQRLEQDQERFEQQKDKMMEKARLQAKEIVSKAKQESEIIITDLRKMAMEEQASIKEHKLIEVRKKLEEAEPQTNINQHKKRNTKIEKVKAGDEIRVLSLGQKGHIVELVGDAEAVVQLGIMKMKVDRSDIEVITLAPKKTIQKVAAGVKRTRQTDDVKMEIDLRGSNVEEGILEVDRFLDESFLSNLGQIYIIHGKGTGVLRNGIQDFLRRHPHVKSYRYGNFGEGGDGVTVVELQ